MIRILSSHLTIIGLGSAVRTAAPNVVSVVIGRLVFGFSRVSFVRWLTWGTVAGGGGRGVVGRFGWVIRGLGGTVSANGYSGDGTSVGYYLDGLDVLDLAVMVILASVSFATASRIKGLVIGALNNEYELI